MNRIREIRSESRITQKELAEAIGVSQPYIHDLEVGNRRLNPVISAKIADILNVREDDLCD